MRLLQGLLIAVVPFVPKTPSPLESSDAKESKTIKLLYNSSKRSQLVLGFCHWAHGVILN